MLTTERERRICAKYKAKDKDGRVHCHECPLSNKGFKGLDDLECKSFMHYDRSKRKWVMDDDENQKEATPCT